MKSAPFAYERPNDISGVLALMAMPDVSTKIMAGGQSLGPMLNLRLAAPDVIVDITALPELKRADTDNGDLILGACVTHADIEDGRTSDVTRGAMQRVASAIAYRAVRNRGTIGGSLSHADPSADWVSALAALGATLMLQSANATRHVAMVDFVLGALETSLKPGEIVVSIRIPPLPASARWGYAKSCRKPGEFARAIGAVLIDPDAATARVVIGAIEAAPIVIGDASELFGGKINGDFKQTFDVRVADRILAAAGLTDAADRQIHIAILRRAVAEAAA